MDDRRGRRLGAALLAGGLAPVAAAAAFLVLDLGAGTEPMLVGGSVALAMGISYPVVGALLLSRQPRHPIGWLFWAMGLSLSLTLLAGEYAIRGLVVAPGSLPGAAFAGWLQGPMASWVFAAGLPLLLLLFPDGRPPSRRWRPVLWLLALLLLIQESVVVLFRMRLVAVFQRFDLGLANPTGVIDPGLLGHGALRAVIPAIDLLFAVVIAACGGALVLRLRRSRGIERQQARWLAYAGALALAGIVLGLLAQAAGQVFLNELALDAAFVVAAVGIPVATAFALLRYHLYGIDVVISRTLLVGAMAAFITAVYVAVVVGLGSLAGLGSRSSLALSLLATALVAVAFQPVRERVQRLANRLVYGERASPYRVLAQFGRTVAGPDGGEELLPRTARVVAEGVGATRAQLWMRMDAGLVLAAAWPEAPAGAPLAPQPASEDLRLPGSDWSVPIRHRGELLGALAVAMPPGQELSRAEARLLRDLAAQTAVVLRNVRLTAALRARLEEITRQEAELRRSRQRVVAAQDAERRRLERNIHDGAQQHLVALAVKLRLAASLAGRDPGRALELAGALRGETRQALATLDELTHGIYPPLLAERGLGPALRAEAGRMAVAVEVVELGQARAAPAAEYAAYLCCLEALQNAAKHSGAARVVVRLEADDRELRFTVSDDGVGFDEATAGRGTGLAGMRDRAEAVGGRLRVHAAPGAGVTVRGAVPRGGAGAPA